MFWHAGFPLLVIAYALHRDQLQEIGPRQGGDRYLVMCIVAAVVASTCGLTALATAGQDMLPQIMEGNHYTPAMMLVVTSIWMLSVVALVAVWWRRQYSVLDMWLMVVLSAWVFDIALSAVLNAGRYDLGFYGGRIYGLVATGCVLAVLLIESSSLYSRLIDTHRSDREKSAKLEQLSATDALTGIANRRAFEQALDQEWRRTMRHASPLCLLMIDVDYFKRFNDTYGHPAGDECLRSVANVLANNARRAGELAARYGGEEFAVLLPLVDAEEAHKLAERICSEVRRLGMPHEGSEVAGHVTISVGVASVSMISGSQRGAPSDRPEARAGVSRPASAVLVELADEALYAAKAGGRNRAVSARIDALVASSPRRSAR
jgi:diguanylate cyclase (GGDEF)-like protein